MTSSRPRTPADDEAPPAAPLAAAAARAPDGAKPDDLLGDQKAKKNYAQNLIRELAFMLARCLDREYPKARVLPRADGTGQEATIGEVLDKKRTDVSVWDDAAGLILAPSVKTYSFRDFHAGTRSKPDRVGRYQRNVKRNDLELRDEADVLHRRQPYAVVVGIFFTPKQSCWDGDTGHSSFAHIVHTFRKRAGRPPVVEHDRPDRMEKVYIGLIDDITGRAEFFDVEFAPPWNQYPSASSLKSLPGLISSVTELVERRNCGGLTAAERYAPDDPTWQRPALPDAFDGETPSSIDVAFDTPFVVEILDEDALDG